MALDVWFPQDVSRILRAVARAGFSVGEDAGADPRYMDGYRDALAAVAEGFGLVYPLQAEQGPPPEWAPLARRAGR